MVSTIFSVIGTHDEETLSVSGITQGKRIKEASSRKSFKKKIFVQQLLLKYQLELLVFLSIESFLYAFIVIMYIFHQRVNESDVVSFIYLLKLP